MSNRTHAHAQARGARLTRLPPIIQRLIADPETALQFLAMMPMVRMMIAAGHEPTPGLGLAEHDAMFAILSDALGAKRLSDEEFEQALIVSTPPECRGTLQ
jgi:hypothetical protein